MPVDKNHVTGEEYWTVIKNLQEFKKSVNKGWKEIREPNGKTIESKESPFPSVPNIAKYVGLHREGQETESSRFKTMTLNFVKAATNMVNYYFEPHIHYTDLYEKQIDWSGKILVNADRSFDKGVIAGVAGTYYGYTLNDAKEGRLTGNFLKIYSQKNSLFKAFFVNRIETEEVMKELSDELINTEKIDEAIKIYKVFLLKHNGIPSRFYTGTASIEKYSLNIDLSLEGKKTSFTKIMFPIRLYAQNGNAGTLYLGGIGMRVSGIGFDNYSLKAQKIALLRYDTSCIPQEIFSLNSPLIFPFLISRSSETKIYVNEQEDRDFYTSIIIGRKNNYDDIEKITDCPEDVKAKLKRYIDYLEVVQKKVSEAYTLCNSLVENTRNKS